jgi:acetoacetyl-CoA synthetase
MTPEPPPVPPSASSSGETPPVREGDLLFEPSPERIAGARLTAFVDWLRRERGVDFASYDELWRWSVEDLEGFWTAVADHLGLLADRGDGPVLELAPDGGVAGANWFRGTRLSYAEQALSHPPDDLAVIALDEDGEAETITYGELAELVRAVAAGLAGLGVEEGDRVAAVLPNNAAAVVAFLATASLGAIWTSCAPEFGAPSMVDRFVQVSPKVLIAGDGYKYNGRVFEIGDKVRQLRSALPGLGATILVTCLIGVPPSAPSSSGAGGGPGEPGDVVVHWNDLLTGVSGAPAGEEMEWERTAFDEPADAAIALPAVAGAGSVGGTGRVGSVAGGRRLDFDHPLWILYSSGTTGLPKPIVHSHGGIVLEHLKVLALHTNLRRGDRFFWYTTTGWMMWNFLVGGLLVGATIICYDGSPAWPDQDRLFRLAEETQINCLGTSAPFLEACRRSGLSPRAAHDLSSVTSVGSTGAPLSPDGFAWATREIGDDVLVASVSGGTDVCTAFVGTCPTLPVYAGELQCRALGASVAAFGPDGQPVVGEVGELVVTRPMPSMPIYFWGDEDGSRMRASYFDTYPGVWRHGDWVKITERGTCVVYGRSDATLNRGGVRMGTAEFYSVVESFPGVADSLVVDTSQLGEEGKLILLIVPAGPTDRAERDELSASIRAALRERLSPRHVPDAFVYVSKLPRTLNGKKVEVPVRRILLGSSIDSTVSADALADPTALVELVAALRDSGLLHTDDDRDNPDAR